MSRLPGLGWRRWALPVLLVLVVCSVLPVGAQPSGGDLPWRDKSSPFGVAATLGNRVRAEDLDAAVALLRESGAQWQREEIFWDRVQWHRGEPFIWNGDGSGLYDYDRAIGAQVEAGVNVIGLLDYNPRWFKGQNPHPDEWLEDWGIFVYQAVARYGRDRGWIKHWQLWNEPNLSKSGYESGLYSPEDFARILAVGNAAAKAADPEAKIIMGGMSGLTESVREHDYDPFAYLEAVGQAGGWNHVDIIALHPYHHGAPPEALIQRFERSVSLHDEMAHLDDLLRRYGARPVWLTELGWTTSGTWPGVSETEQAVYLVRAYMLALSHPSVEKIFWYDFRNDTYPDADYANPVYNANDAELHYGLLRRSYPLDPNQGDLRKPAFVAFRTMTQMLGGLNLQEVAANGRSAEHPEFYWYRFAGGERRVDVIWRTNDQRPQVPLRCDCREAVVRSWQGRVRQVVYAVNGEVTIRPAAPGVPLYIEYDPPATPDGEYFEVTGHNVRGAFLEHWQTGGGVERFGYPITQEIIEPELHTGRPRVVQYFERTRLELYPELAGTPLMVQSGGLGWEALSHLGLDIARLPRLEPGSAPPECRYVEATGFHVCPPFLAVWERYADRSPLGNPLSEGFEALHPETGQPYVAQYFERARLEHYPEQGETAVYFGLLGRELFTAFGSMW